MITSQLIPLLFFATLIHFCYSNENVSQLVARRELLQKQALDTYRVACLRLQAMANWMSVFFKLKSAWTSTQTRSVMANPILNIEKDVGNVFGLPKRPKISPNGSECASLRSLQVTLQTYIHFQAQLLQLKAALGSLALKSSQQQLGATSILIQERIGNLDILNKTSLDIFDKLKQSSQFLTDQNSPENFNFASIFKDIKSSSVSYLQGQKGVFIQARNAHDLNKELLQAGGFFQSLGQALDKILAGSLFHQ
ncbi:hypothetical protein JTE90_026483 [Oedothorax gibbosus]|uniref:Uncharacterized protein n=1 Tax=Oedothorax gibbosus TaxID=931172 RepID=A0AAV6VPM5_9ARAC|nr:hypothetical protein JTE90_026483 [Oedothorax gibbosus]